MVEVNDILRLPAFRGVNVIAGKDGLNRKVENVAVMEIPDIMPWLRGNDILITSFYSLPEEGAQCRLIEELADSCSCIAVKIGTYIQTISDSVKETADRVGLPLLEIPMETPYTDLIMNIMAVVLEEGNNERIVDRFLKDVVYERYSDQILMTKRGNLLGFDFRGRIYTAINIQYEHHYKSSVSEQGKLRNYCRQLRDWLRGHLQVCNCHLIDNGKYCILIVESSEPKTVDSLIRKRLTEDGRMKGWYGETGLVCGVGPDREGLQGIRSSYSLSFDAVKVGQALYRDMKMFFYDDLEIFCELEQLFSRTETTDLFANALNGVKDDLIETMITYYECNRSLQLTAERLYTHKNTVKYRLKQIQEQTGLDFKNSRDNFRLYLAVLAIKLRDI